ncbi:MAG: alpha/beta hydrolase [Mobiluncus sp.]|nr:alpha/beta hydrolase [Mobiluncus sp.]
MNESGVGGKGAMIEKTYETPRGTIHYWVGGEVSHPAPRLVFLPGLTADHRLFNAQLAHFASRYPTLVWDAPGHAASRPFDLTFSLADKARWLHEILVQEGFDRPVFVGQSMGGYVAQSYLQQFPGSIAGLVSIDSAPLGRAYTTAAELWLLKRMEPIYRLYPWKLLLRHGSNGVATTASGRALMREMMLTYDPDPAGYARLAGHGYRILAEAMEADLPYRIDCPALLICGEKDHAGSTRRYNRAWQAKTGIPLKWVKDAGHNANTDQPEVVNRLIDEFIETLRHHPGE